MSSERCVRCGEEGEDRRTLAMACFYEMSELDVPFKSEVLFHAKLETLVQVQEPVSIEIGGKKMNLAAGTLSSPDPLTPEKFYTLRVCKDCRASWMQMIQQWFRSPEQDQGEADQEATIPIRRLGAIKYLTPKQWESEYRS